MMRIHQSYHVKPKLSTVSIKSRRHLPRKQQKHHQEYFFKNMASFNVDVIMPDIDSQFNRTGKLNAYGYTEFWFLTAQHVKGMQKDKKKQ